MRKTIDYMVDAEGRDKGKVFQITEMPASQAQRWARALFSSLSRAGVDVGSIQWDMEGLTKLGIQSLALVPVYEQDVLIAELMGCLRIKPDRGHPEVVRDLVMDDDIEEPMTHFLLQMEVLRLHLNFSMDGKLQTSGSTTSTPPPVPPSSPTPMSRRRSPPPSPRVSPR